uniref:Uncharacterized protein n=1 Tax=Rhizophora mucronata TaxID=61149 RepID=A0A2P2JYK3_RHIMU
MKLALNFVFCIIFLSFKTFYYAFRKPGSLGFAVYRTWDLLVSWFFCFLAAALYLVQELCLTQKFCSFLSVFICHRTAYKRAQ